MSSPSWIPPVVVLFEPQNGLNIGAVARACRNFGIEEIRLLSPADPDPRRWQLMAPGCEAWIDEHVRTYDSWQRCVEGLGVLVAFTSRARREAVAEWSLMEACERVSLSRELPVGFVFGREDHGLPTWVVDACNATVSFDTAPDWASLNLAQAVLLAVSRAWESHSRVDYSSQPVRVDSDAGQRELLMERAEIALEQIDFFKGDQRANIMRTLRRLLLRAEPDPRELATLLGIVRETLRTLND